MEVKLNKILNDCINYKSPKLIISNLQLNTIPRIPEHINYLDCSNNNLTFIPKLPNNIKYLICNNNQITNIKSLPKNLIKLECNNNKIFELNNLPENLNVLIAKNNNIEYIKIPLSIIILELDNNVEVLNIQELINYKTVSYREFDKFYKENIQKCFINKIYSVNVSNINKWIYEIQQFQDADLTTFAYCISKTLKHVSFPEFYNNLCNLGYKLQEFTNLHNVPIYIYIPDIKKSNLWILLLIWKFIIKTQNIFIINNINKNLLTYFKNKNNEILYKFVYIDDCIYTGQQMFEEVANFVNVNVFTVYLSSNAHKKYVNMYNLNYSKLIPNFEETLKPHELKSYEIVKTKYKKYVNNVDNINICNIYFDHKLPDFVSVFQNIYAYGQLPNNHTVGSFIEGCQDFYKSNNVLSSEEDEDYKILDIQNIIKEICPPAFYKTINYTINNQIISSVYQIKNDF